MVKKLLDVLAVVPVDKARGDLAFLCAWKYSQAVRAAFIDNRSYAVLRQADLDCAVNDLASGIAD
eukprot:3439002-Prorocentrum_lima.AAC.1